MTECAPEMPVKSALVPMGAESVRRCSSVPQDEEHALPRDLVLEPLDHLVLPDHRCVILVLRHPAGLELDVEVVVLEVKLVHRIRLLQRSEQALQACLHPDLVVSAKAQVCGHFAVHL